MSAAPETPTPTDSGPVSPRRSVLIITALGIVFGDIGTSPLYALRECFAGEHAVRVYPSNILGAVSLILWFLLIVVCIKYVLFVMKADNKGEGGILALMALVHRIGPTRVRNWAILPVLGIIGVALLLSDGAITPAISVLSAVEGLHVAAPFLSPLVIPLSIIVLAALFFLQSRGTAAIGTLFGPVMVLWFGVMGVLGLVSIVHAPGILYAINPLYAIQLLHDCGLTWKIFWLLGAAFLAVTGVEVLYADMGHFGKSPIRFAWFVLVFPALILNYMGQGASLLRGASADNLFYQLAPHWFQLPLVMLATLATIIASQAVISGAFSLARQSVQLGFWPRMKIVHTSTSIIGQVFIPVVNGILFILVLLLILGFRKSTNLGAAYGIAVATTMVITTVLLLIIAPKMWNAPKFIIIPIGIFFLAFEVLLFAANISKVFSGGWVVVLMAAAVYILMTTWIEGRRILQKRVIADAMDLELFTKGLSVQQDVVRTKRTAVFLSGNLNLVPRALLHNFKHNGVLQEKTIIVTIQTTETPYVAEAERFQVVPVGEGIFRVALRYGFMESPDIPSVIARIPIPGGTVDSRQFSYFLGKETLVLTNDRSMAGWRKQIFMFMSKNALDASSFFNLVPNRVVELGARIEF